MIGQFTVAGEWAVDQEAETVARVKTGCVLQKPTHSDFMCQSCPTS